MVCTTVQVINHNRACRKWEKRNQASTGIILVTLTHGLEIRPPYHKLISGNHKVNCSKGCLILSCFIKILFLQEWAHKIYAPPQPCQACSGFRPAVEVVVPSSHSKWFLASAIEVAEPRPSPGVHCCRIWGNLNPLHICCEFRFFRNPRGLPSLQENLFSTGLSSVCRLR